jgi:hypothetical protein
VSNQLMPNSTARAMVRQAVANESGAVSSAGTGPAPKETSETSMPV